jgi:nitrogen fixation protein FixH
MEYREEEITGTHIIIAIFSFFSIALGNSCSLDAYMQSCE